MAPDDAIKKLNELGKKVIASDKRLYDALRPYFDSVDEVEKYIIKCLRKLTTRRMLLRVQWYVELAEHINKAREARPALPLIFLMAMAENTIRYPLSKAKARSSGFPRS